MKKVFRSIKYWLLVVWLSSKWIFKINLGDSVIYKGEKYIAVQGVSDPYWVIMKGEDRLSVHKKDFKKEKTIKNFLKSFNSGYRFYMRSWFGIWVNSGIQGWMKGCKIW